jgi:osmotically inducible protein OsmC
MVEAAVGVLGLVLAYACVAVLLGYEGGYGGWWFLAAMAVLLWPSSLTLLALGIASLVKRVATGRRQIVMPIRKSEAYWEGSLTEGVGTMKPASGLCEGPYTFSSRFEEAAGTNPEELLGAAHAGCFSMFLSSLLTERGYLPARIQTTAGVHLGAGPQIKKIELVTEASVPGLGEAEFQEAAAAAKGDCPVSRALAAVPEITLSAKLVG